MTSNTRIKRKSTFFLSEDTLSEIKELIAIKGLRSQNALVEEALREYIDKTRREIRRQSYLEAIRDPRFLKDMEDVEKDFQFADAETASMIK